MKVCKTAESNVSTKLHTDFTIRYPKIIVHGHDIESKEMVAGLFKNWS